MGNPAELPIAPPFPTQPHHIDTRWPFGAVLIGSGSERKLLLNRAEIDKLDIRTAQGGLTIVPLRLYWKGGRAKMELGLAKGRTKGDKRQNMAERDADREIETAFNRAVKYGNS